MNPPNPPIEKAKPVFERLGESLYWKGGKIVARVRVNGKLTWRSTETNEAPKARQWLKKWREEEWQLRNGIQPKGVNLHRTRVTVSELIEEYVKAGFPTRKMRRKTEATITNEKACLRVITAYFGNRTASGVALVDCDKYRDWRLCGGYFTGNREREGKKHFARLKSGNRSVDLELTILSNVLNLAVRRGTLDSNALAGRSRYTHAADIRHCREVAPSPEALQQIMHWLRLRDSHEVADLVCFLAYSGLRIGEALPLDWEAVDLASNVIHVLRQKRGIFPWVPILPEMAALLQDMRKQAKSPLLFPSPFEPNIPRDDSAVRHRIAAACKGLGLDHVTPHGLRSYFVTQARQGGLSDAEIAMLIGDKSGPAIIATTYGDVRPDHLLQQAQRIRLTVQAKPEESSIKSSNTLPDVSQSVTASTIEA